MKKLIFEQLLSDLSQKVRITMITIDVLTNFLRISVPTEMKSQAPVLLADIWRDEFKSGATFRVELTEPVQKFIEKAKLNFSILVYQ